MSRMDGVGPFARPRVSPARTGSLLVAEPDMGDPNFAGAVVLLLNHSDDGTLGVILNKALPAPVADVLPAWGGHVSAPNRLFLGGPVARDSAIGLAVLPGDGPEPMGVRRVVGVFAVVDLDAPPEMVRPSVAGVRVFAGHAGWSAGQLEAELDQGAWFVVAAEPADVIRPDVADLRRSVLRRQTSSLALLSTMPLPPHRVDEN